MGNLSSGGVIDTISDGRCEFHSESFAVSERYVLVGRSILTLCEGACCEPIDWNREAEQSRKKFTRGNSAPKMR